MTQQASLEFDGVRYDSCCIKDLSLSGMFVFGDFNQKTGDECIIRYSQESTASHFQFKAKAKVTRIANDGLAIEYVSMPFDSYMLLQTTLLYEAVDPMDICLEIPENCPFEITIESSRETDEDSLSNPSLPIMKKKIC